MEWVNVQCDERGVAVVAIDNAARLKTLNPAVMRELGRWWSVSARTYR